MNSVIPGASKGDRAEAEGGQEGVGGGRRKKGRRGRERGEVGGKKKKEKEGEQLNFELLGLGL